MNRNRLPKLEYLEPYRIEEAVELKTKFGKNSVFLAGGTDVVPLLKRRNISPVKVINTKYIPELKKISYDAKVGLEVGAAVTLREAADYPAIAASYPLLVRAVQSVAYNQIRNMATLVGNICVDNKCSFYNQSSFWWQSRPDCFKRGGDRCFVVKGGKQCYALSAGDTVSALIALNASLSIAGLEGTRQTALEDFYTGDGKRPHKLDDKEIVTAVLVPPPEKDWREGFLKKSRRGAVDFAIATLSIRLKDHGNGLEDIKIVLNGVSTKPIRAVKAEAFFIGKLVDGETIEEAVRVLLKEATPLSSIGTPVSVRRCTIDAMVNDLMETLMGKA